MSHKILEVLIPTYRRPHAAIGAIDSVLASDNPNVSAFCHSNGTEPELEIAAALRPQLRYAYFPENRGAVANFRKMLEDSDATYVLFLSDEDRINPNLLDKFIDYLSQNEHGFVMCSVVESTGASYFSVAALDAETLSFKDLITLFTLSPTYLSGYCFRRDLLNDDALNLAFDENEANVYPHLILRNTASKNSRVGIFGPSIIIKGAEANTGGDSHSHIKIHEKTKHSTSTRRLNPSIYGTYARANQFYYLNKTTQKELNRINRIRRFFIKLNLVSTWLKTTQESILHAECNKSQNQLNELLEENDNLSSKDWSIYIFNKILKIKNNTTKTALIKLLWNISKTVKMLFFIERLGLSKTIVFIKTKSNFRQKFKASDLDHK